MLAFLGRRGGITQSMPISTPAPLRKLLGINDPGYKACMVQLFRQGNSVDLAGSPAACRRIRTRGLFSAIEEQVGEKGENAVHYVYYVPKSP